MGAFILFREKEIENINQVNKEFSDVFTNKGLEKKKRFTANDCTIDVYGKRNVEVKNFIAFSNGDFIIGTGTYIYKNRIEENVLKIIYDNILNIQDLITDIKGNYAMIVFKEGKLYLFNDLSGGYHIYSLDNRNVFSSSFITLVKITKKLEISKQEFYEYILTGSFYGSKTVFKNISRIESEFIHIINPSYSKVTKKSINIHDFEELAKLPLKTQLIKVSSELLNFFKEIKDPFDTKISIPLTGGYDSRLAYAALKKAKVIPNNAFVLKKDHQPDVRIAEKIAECDGLDLILLSNNFPDYKKDKTLKLLKDQFYLYDGLGIGGVFQFFSGLDVWMQLKYKKLILDGTGGEIYRNMHRLPNRKISVIDYVQRVINKKSTNFCTSEFNQDIYNKVIESKIKSELNIAASKMSRMQSEMIFPKFYLKYWFGSVVSNANQFCYFLAPFFDSRIALQSYYIPIKFKNNGYFEAKLIKEIDIELAKIVSNYGYNFYDNISLKSWAIELIKIYSPQQI